MTEDPGTEGQAGRPTARSRGEWTRGRRCRWRQVDWRRAEADVRRLRQRIFTASKAGDLPRVRRLQKLMLRSRANTLISVRRVTERNAGRLTAGVDGEVVLTPEAKMQLVDRMQRTPSRSRRCRSGGCTSPSRAAAPSAAIRDSRDRRSRAIRHGSSMRWSPSGRRGSSRGPTDSGRAAAARTRSRPSIAGRQGQEPEAAVGAGRGPGSGVRPDRPRPHSSR